VEVARTRSPRHVSSTKEHGATAPKLLSCPRQICLTIFYFIYYIPISTLTLAALYYASLSKWWTNHDWLISTLTSNGSNTVILTAPNWRSLATCMRDPLNTIVMCYCNASYKRLIAVNLLSCWDCIGYNDDKTYEHIVETFCWWLCRTWSCDILLGLVWFYPACMCVQFICV